MASCFDVVHLEDTIFVSCCKDVKRQGSRRCFMLSTLITMVEILHALQSLWATLFPYALLWWNALLYATCAKYYSWNRSRLRLHIAGWRFYGDIMQDSSSFSEASNGEGREKSLLSRGLCADASYTQNREISVSSLYQEGTCDEAVHVEKNDVGSISHQQRKSHHSNHDFGVSIDPFPHQSGLCMLDGYGGATPACLEESGLHHLHQVEEGVSRETTSLASKALVIGASSHTSKLSSLCFVEGRQPEPSGLLKGCHWAARSFLSPHQTTPLAMLGVHRCPQTPLEYLSLQVNLHRNGNMLGLKAPMLIDHISLNWLQTLNGGCVAALNCGKKYPDLAWSFTRFLTRQTRDNNYAILQFILSTTEGFNIFNAISPYDAMEIVKLRIGEQPSLWDLSGFKMNHSVAYIDNEDGGSACSEGLGTVSCTSVKSDDGWDGMYCSDAESTIDRDNGFEDSGVDYGKQCYRDDGYNCYRGHEGSGMASVQNAEDVHGSFVHPAMYKSDGFYDCSAHCDVGYDGLHRVTDVDGICSMDYDSADGDYNNFDDNFEDSGAVCGDLHFAYEDEVYENPLDIRQIHVAKSNTWWDEGAVLVDKRESEEDSIEEEWEVV